MRLSQSLRGFDGLCGLLAAYFIELVYSNITLGEMGDYMRIRNNFLPMECPLLHGLFIAIGITLGRKYFTQSDSVCVAKR